MHILLTRPAGRNEPLAGKLAALGWQSSCCPMVEIVSEPSPAASPLAQADAAFFVSTNAVDHAARLVDHWPRITYLAVGGATARALRQQGLQPLTAPRDNETTEGIWTLPQMDRVVGKRFVIVRGNGGREAMAKRLIAEGAEVIYWQVYRRQLPKLNGLDLAQSWQRRGVNAILATSVEILQNLFTLLPPEQHPWLTQQLWLVPVERVADAARQLGCHQTLVTGGAGDDAILESIANWKNRQ
ncbi:uroporphyrinogen-III synthase [Ferrimonas sediminicola]|uniref:Uroporphyrinogen-III synthase n=1 Tax=Ferrimonas sediminicola TaxID=2569538 RepID=A0A4U1BI00_9GAMM|nr:uroporphyrinogen-III synthase [Ferrimonas sediminicola]TKB51086.1 uroporphyrinogen-III synthase [Ferrimonas sediminicola]